jgi:hypothetical protein
MVKEKTSDKYKCEECGVMVVVDEPCGCEPCDLTSCNVPMAKMKSKTGTKKKPKSVK